MRIIVDTNILINVLLSPSRKSASFRVIELCLKQKVIPQMGAALFCEYEDVSKRTKIVAKSTYSELEINTLLDGIFSVSKWHKIHFLWRPNLKDEGDNHLIDLAVASNARYIITHNMKDLTSGELRFGFDIVTPENFLKKEKKTWL